MRPAPLARLLIVSGLGAEPAAAEIAPDALWSAWQKGTPFVTATAGRAVPGEAGLAIEDATLRLGSGADTLVVEAARLILTPEGAATQVALPDAWTLAAPSGRYDVTAPGLTVRASGSAEAPAYAVAAPRVAAEGPYPGGGALALALTGATGDVAADGALLAVDRVALDLSDARNDLEVVAERSDVTVELKGAPAALFAPGTSPFEIEIRSGAGAQSVAMRNAEGRATTLQITTDTSLERGAMAGERLSLEQTAEAMTLRAAGEGVPLPDASATIDRVRSTFGISAGDAAEPRQFSHAMTLAGIAPSEQVWQLIDPAAELPRAPAALNLALSGIAAPGPGGTLRPERVALEALRIEALDATVTGQGSVTFADPPGRGADPGRPVGALAFTMTGMIGLLDRLDALGSLPPGPLIGARMGLGLFTRPGEGEDTLETRVEFAPDGAIVVNDQPVGRLP